MNLNSLDQTQPLAGETYLKTNIEVLSRQEVGLVRRKNTSESYYQPGQTGFRGVSWDDLLGQAPSLWNVWAAVNVARVDTAAAILTNETMLADQSTTLQVEKAKGMARTSRYEQHRVYIYSS